MEQLTIASLDQAREQINTAHRQTFNVIKENFIKLGYIFRQVQDMKLYAEGGYDSLSDFAKEEYGYSRSQVSRFIKLNIEYSKDGNSSVLDDRWKEFDQTKLIEMIQLPESIREEVDPEIKRDDLRELRKDVEEANEEAKEATFKEMLSGEKQDTWISALIKSKKEKAKEIFEAITGSGEREDIRVAFNDSGFGFVRAGAAVIFFKQDKAIVSIGSEKTEYTYPEFATEIMKVYPTSGMSFDGWYEAVTGERMKEPATDVVDADHEDVVNAEPLPEENDKPLPAKDDFMNKPEYEETESKTKTEITTVEDTTVEENTENKTAVENTEQEDAETEEKDTRICVRNGTGNYHIRVEHADRSLYVMVGAGRVSVAKIDYCPMCGKKL